MRKIIQGTCVLLLSAFVCVNANVDIQQRNESELNYSKTKNSVLEVIGNASGYSLITLPTSVVIIDADEIAASGASTILDVLATKANLNLQSFNETGKNSSIDIRGMGATAVSNVLLLVDGERLNVDDLSGADYSNLPLENIERIEVIRGSGSVRYGNGAVGGAINVITRKRVSGKTYGKVHYQYGSYDQNDLRTYLNLSKSNLHLTANLSKYRTEGFRDNGGLDRTALNGRLEYDLNKTLGTFVKLAVVDDKAGLPGPVTLQDFRGTTRTRQSTQDPFNFSNTEEQRYGIGIQYNNNNTEKLTLSAGFRQRKNPFILGFTPLLTEEEQISQIQLKTHSANLNYENNLALFDQIHQIQAGIELQKTDYLRRSNGINLVSQSERREGTVERSGGFIEMVFNGPAGLSLTSGYRLERYSSQQTDKTLQEITSTCDTRNVIRPIPTPPFAIIDTELFNCQNAFLTNTSDDDTWYNHAGALGLRWQLNESLSFYMGVHQNFRSPNVDELLFASTNLGPQKGLSKDIGVQLSNSDQFTASINFFSLKIENEIVFAEDPNLAMSVNRNLDTVTKREGLELDINTKPSSNISLSLGLGYVRPRLVEQDADVPLVPRITASAALQYELQANTKIKLQVNHASKRIDGNDFGTSDHPRLKPYTVIDFFTQHQIEQFNLFAGIRNLTNEIYSTVAFSASYYPMPERNAFIGVNYSF